MSGEIKVSFKLGKQVVLPANAQIELSFSSIWIEEGSQSGKLTITVNGQEIGFVQSDIFVWGVKKDTPRHWNGYRFD